MNLILIQSSTIFFNDLDFFRVKIWKTTFENITKMNSKAVSKVLVNRFTLNKLRFQCFKCGQHFTRCKIVELWSRVWIEITGSQDYKIYRKELRNPGIKIVIYFIIKYFWANLGEILRRWRWWQWMGWLGFDKWCSRDMNSVP